MNTVFMLAEILTTFIEGILLFLTAELFCGKRLESKRNLGAVVLLSSIYTVAIIILNRINMQSMVTLFFAILFTTCLSGFITFRSFIYKLLIISQYSLIIVVIDAVINILVGVILGNPELPYHIVSTVGINRTAYISGIKGLEILIFIILKRHIKNPPDFSFMSLVISLLLSLLAFLSVNYTYNAVLSVSVQRMQISLSLAWIALLAAVILLQIFFSIKAKQKEKEQENEMLQSVNAMIEKNYENLERSYLENAKNIHDFRHHVMALDVLLTEGEFEEAQGYIRSLHEAEAHSFSAVITGNAVIDAVLNAHHSSAQASGIDFSVTAQPLPDHPVHFSVAGNHHCDRPGLFRLALSALLPAFLSSRPPVCRRLSLFHLRRVLRVELPDVSGCVPGRPRFAGLRLEAAGFGLRRPGAAFHLLAGAGDEPFQSPFQEGNPEKPELRPAFRPVGWSGPAAFIPAGDRFDSFVRIRAHRFFGGVFDDSGKTSGKEENTPMNSILGAIASLIEQIANYGAGVTSMWNSYQPKTPACLQDED